jgi:membrane protein implicated in regulation of membrane protease activity
VTGMRLGIASFVLLLVAGVLLFWSVWAGLALFVASVVVHLSARTRFAKEELPARRTLR